MPSRLLQPWQLPVTHQNVLSGFVGAYFPIPSISSSVERLRVFFLLCRCAVIAKRCASSRICCIRCSAGDELSQSIVLFSSARIRFSSPGFLEGPLPHLILEYALFATHQVLFLLRQFDLYHHQLK